MHTFNIDFRYDHYFAIDGVEHVFDGKVVLTAHYNGKWEIDNIEGTLIIDPQDGDYVFDLSKTTTLAWAVRHWLRTDSDFRDYADDKVRFYRHD